MILPAIRKYTLVVAAVLLMSALLDRALQPTATQAQQATPQRVTIKLPGGAKPIPSGPFAPTWESIRRNYKVPQWFLDGKFGIMIHWGLYAVPAHVSEWYATHMYNNPEVVKWHREHFGPQDKFGYKDFIPLFKAEKFNPGEWAELFKQAGAKYVVPAAEHHDGFALYDSALTRWDAKDMGPQRDLIGDLAQAVRQQGLQFGVSHQFMENWSFMYPTLNITHDLLDPAYAEFYGPPPPRRARQGAAGQAGAPQAPGSDAVMEGQSAPESKEFLGEWLMRVQELIDKYQPDMLWFDNGVNSRARQWRKEVSISTKSEAYLAGSIRDFERQSRAPKELTDYVWQVDDPVLYRFGYTEGSPVTNANTVVHRLVENVSKKGALLLNISPKADSTIPDDQKQLLREIGEWMALNGEAIYGTRPWTRFGEGRSNRLGASLGRGMTFASPRRATRSTPWL